MIPCCLRLLAAVLLGTGEVPPTPVLEPAHLYYDGRILLNDSRGSARSALLERDGRVVAVGTLEELSRRVEAKGAQRIDLEGGVAVPGLQDAHIDLDAMVESLDWLDLTECTSYAQLIQRVSARAAQLPPGSWVLGQGWDQNKWGDHQLPHHLLLSAQVPKNPVYLEHAAGEFALVNSAALERAKLDGPLEPPPRVQGGRVLVDEQHRASGLLVQEARGLARTLFPGLSADQRRKNLLAVQEQLLAEGLTCVHDQGTSPELLKVLRELRATDKLKLRFVCYPEVSGDLQSSDWPKAPVFDAPLDLLSIPGVHLCLDGPVSARSAALLEPYADQSKERGVLLMDEDRFSQRLSQAAQSRLQPVIEAHGDRSARLALDTLQRLYAGYGSARALRPRIEGVQVVAPKDWPRFPELSVLPCLQPSRWLRDMVWLEDALGEERFAGTQAWRMLAPDLRRLALGSGATDPRSASPKQTLYAARVRPGSEMLEDLNSWQLGEAESALNGMTAGAAWGSFQEERRGRLMPNFQCDMTVLSTDPVHAKPNDLLRARVTLVVVNGEIVYRPR
ncbi:MAG: amidohydrolase [Planctomycetes bacterium]|nr:amidohydrolase [Planctomycetota bacterium]